MKKLLSIVLAALLVCGCLPIIALADEAPTGYVTVSITDNGDREYLMAMGDMDEDEIEYAEPFGAIVAATQVPIYAGDTVASALVRLFDMNGITYNAYGTADYNGGFYLQNITFTKDGVTVENFGEGSITPDDEYMYYFSGWMVKINNWFSSSGVSDYYAEDGDVIEMLYTCGMGADIGNNFYDATAAFTGLTASAGTLSPAFSADVKEYTLTVDADTESVKLAADNKNCASVVTYKVGDVAYKYMRDIPVSNGTVIVINSKFYTTDYQTQETTLADEDEITVTVVKPEKPAEPTEPADGGEKSVLEQIRDFFARFTGFFASLWQKIVAFFRNLVK